MNAILELDRVSKRFGDVVGVAEASLDIAEGEFVTLLGPSGCGKSTLLRMIGGFETPSSGRVLLDGADVTDVPPHRRPVNMVFQDYALFPHLSVGRNVGYGLRVRRGAERLARPEIERRARATLDLVGLGAKFDAAPHELSGGQRQRVALARALVRRPRVLLLDEPLSALDANLREAMQVELRHLHDEVGLTFVLVTHDQSEALTLSDRVVVMRAGRIVQTGTPAELYERPATPYVATFVGHTNLFDSAVRHDAAGPYVECHGQALRLAPDVADVAARLASTTFGFRPEGAEIVDAGRRGSNVLHARVADILYHGHGVRVAAELGGGRVAIDLPMRDAHGRAALPARGETVGIEVAPHRLLAFPGGSEPDESGSGDAGARAPSSSSARADRSAA